MPATNQYDARLIYSASESDANMLWATRFFAPDPFIFIEKRSKRYLVMSDLEIDRAKNQASVDTVLAHSAFVKRLQQEGTAFPGAAQVLAAVFGDLKIKKVEVPSTFPVGLADQLRKMKIPVEAKSDPFWPDRELKTKEEVRFINEALRAAESGMEAGIDAVRRSRIRRDGYLDLDGTRLTSEILKRIINTTIMARGYVPSHTIVASGNQCVDPHNQGSGPIRANTSIIMDIFPRSQATGYFGDITRTVVSKKGRRSVFDGFAMGRTRSIFTRKSSITSAARVFPPALPEAACRVFFTAPDMGWDLTSTKRRESTCATRIHYEPAMS